jgi:hypothetical protein
MADRRCKGKTKKGKRCHAPPLKDKDFCSAHDPDTPALERFGSHARARAAGVLGGRPPLPKPTDVARELIEANIAAVLRPHFKAIGLLLNDDGTVEQLDHGAILTGESKDGYVRASDIEDLGAQMAAAEKLMDRVYGRPKQTQEISGPDGNPVEIESPLDATRRSIEAAKIVEQARQEREAIGANGDGPKSNGRH